MPSSATSKTEGDSRAGTDEAAGLGPATLRRVYLDLLGRPPLETERGAWSGRSRVDLVDALLATEEHWRNWLDEQLFYFLLVDNFRPTTDGVRALPRLLAEGQIGVREAIHRICLSSSFDRRNPGPDTFVTVVMEQILGLTVQRAIRDLEIGRKIYDGSPGRFLGQAGSSQADLIHIAMSDSRATTHLLEREYQRLLRQRPRDADVSQWAAHLGTDEEAFSLILRSWLLSDAYEQRLQTSSPQPNRVFVRALHVDLLGRVPDETEAHRFRTALDGLANSSPLRCLIAKLMLDSGKAVVPDRGSIQDPAAWIGQQFERLLGRRPTPGELATFYEAFMDPACRPTTILYSIVSHPEYQTW